MCVFMDLKSTYNKIAKDWMQSHHSDTWWIEGTDKYLSHFESNASLLDIGCGAGEKSKYIIKKGFKITGIDFSEKMIKLAKISVPVGKFFVKDIQQPLNLGKTFDGIFAQAILLHIPKKEVMSVLNNITEPLKSDGYFYIAVKEWRPGNPQEQIVKENTYGYEYERFFSYFTLNELRDYLQKLNMKLVYENVSSGSKTNWIQVVAKKA